jgi:hypothetical protein
VLWADGDVYAGARPYSPFERLLRRRWAVPDDEPASALASRLRSVTEAQAPHLLAWLPLIGIAFGRDASTRARPLAALRCTRPSRV